MTESEFESLVDMISDRVDGHAPWKDVMEDRPDLSEDDAYRLQFALMRRRTAAGDAVVGYKAAYTSVAVQAQRGNGGPVAGALLRSAVLDEDKPIAIVPDRRNAVEPEIAILLAADLPGPLVTPLDVRRATAVLLPAIEVAVGARGNVDRTRHMVIATNKTAGSVIVGGPGRSPDGIDLRVEGCVLEINGKVRGTATAAEVMGDPYVAAAFIANTLLAHGEVLRAGAILMTGSIVAATPIAAGDEVRARFTRLGDIAIRFE